MPKDFATEVNKHISQVASIHKVEDERKLRTEGYLVIDNFLNSEEVDDLRNHLGGQRGYNAHVPKYSDMVLRELSGNYAFPTLSYSPDVLLTQPMRIKYI